MDLHISAHVMQDVHLTPLSTNFLIVHVSNIFPSLTETGKYKFEER